MVRARLVVSVVSAVAFLAVAVPLAHAGGGPGQPLPAGTTACRSVEHEGNPHHVINLKDNAGDQDVHVDPPALLCDLDPEAIVSSVTATIVKGSALATVVTPNVVICYHVGGGHGDKIPATITDVFGTHDVKVGGFKLLCVPAQVQ